MSVMYNKGLEGFIGGDIALDTDTIKAVFLNVSGAGTLYTFSQAHQFLSSISGASIIGTAQTLASKVITDGIFDSADPSFGTIAGGTDTAEAILVYQDTGSSATSRLIAYIDGITLTPDGTAVSIQWDNGANKIFKV